MKNVPIIDTIRGEPGAAETAPALVSPCVRGANMAKGTRLTDGREKPPRPPCVVDGCERPQRKRTWCDKHYTRWRKYGDPTAPFNPASGAVPIAERLAAKLDMSDPDGCWPFTGALHTGGYGHIYVNGKRRFAHRVAFRLAYGYDPPVVCHRCDNPPCCRPDHLFAGTQTDNMRDMWEKGRGSPPPRRPAPEHGTTSRYSGGCRCGPCSEAHRLYMRAYDQRRKAEGGHTPGERRRMRRKRRTA